jgi:hypothetical protein
MTAKMCPFDEWPMETYTATKEGTNVLVCRKCGFEATFKEQHKTKS